MVTTPPSQPISFELSNISQTGMTFQIQDSGSSVGINNRRYQCSTDSNFSGADSPFLSASGPSIGIVTRNDLIPNTVYYWRGYSTNDGGMSAWSTVKSAATLAVVELPSLDSSSITNTGVTLTAAAPSGVQADVYEFSVKLNGVIFATQSNMLNTFVLNNLNASTYYSATVRTYGPNGWSLSSSTLGFNTLSAPILVPDPPICDPPTNVSYLSMTLSIHDGSNNGGSAISLRKYQFSKSLDFSNATTNDFPISGIATCFGLIPGTTYYWRACANNSVGDSLWSNIVWATTLSAGLVNVNKVWKTAIPYVKVNGVWKEAISYVKKNGTWKIPSP